MDPMSLIMFALIGVLIIFMFRNGRKRKAQMEQLQTQMVPGAEVMLQSGIYATIESIDEETNRAVVVSGTSTLVVHRQAIGQVVTAVDAPLAEEEPTLAPDDDPEFGERLSGSDSATTETTDSALNDEAPEANEEKNSDKE